MSNPYLNQNYGFQGYNPGTQNQYQSAAFPYQQPQPTLTQRPVQPHIYGISGRIVNAIDEVTANEVPMDGTTGYFPTSDFSCIYTKTWNPDGTIKTIKYVPEVETSRPDENSQNDISDMISKRFDRIEKLLTRRNYHKPRKESSENE